MTSPSFSTSRPSSSQDGGDRALAIFGWSALTLLIAAVVFFGADRRLGLLESADPGAAQAAELALHRQLDRIGLALGLTGRADTRSGELEQDPARLAEVRRELAAVIAAHPTSRRAYYYQALERIVARDFPGARLAANRALEIEPRDLSATLALAAAHFEEQNYAEAEKALRWAIEIEPRSLAAYDNLGLVLYRMDRQAEALEVHRRRGSVEAAMLAASAPAAPPAASAPAEPSALEEKP